jgi:hypothetical protein
MTYNRTTQINPNRQKVSYPLIPQQAPSSSHPQQKGGRERSREKKKMAEKKKKCRKLAVLGTTDMLVITHVSVNRLNLSGVEG